MSDQWNLFCFFDLSFERYVFDERVKVFMLQNAEAMTKRQYLLEQAHYLAKLQPYEAFAMRRGLLFISAQVDNWVYSWRYNQNLAGRRRLHRWLDIVYQSPLFSFTKKDLDECVNQIQS